MRTLHKSAMLSVFAVLAVTLSGCMPYWTGSTEVGVRTVKWSPLGKKGVEDKAYPPGATQWFVPFVTDWHTFDTRLQNLEMVADMNRGDRRGRDELLFKTVDGNDISLDLVISYRIDAEKAPLILQTVGTTDNELKDNVVRTITRSKPRDIFGELNTEDFYVAEKRNKKAEEVRDALNGILNPWGIVIERVGLRDYRFNPDYQKAIEDKKVADQEAEKLKSETRAVEEQFLTEVEKAKAEIEKIMAEADGEFKRAVIEADAYFEQQVQLAEAIRAEGKAEAEGVSEMNKALAGAGGAAMVKLMIADALVDKRIVMLPMGSGLDVRSTDINALLELYGLRQLTQPKKAAPAKPAAQQQQTPPKPQQRPSTLPKAPVRPQARR